MDNKIRTPEDELPTESVFLDINQVNALLIAIQESTALAYNRINVELGEQDIKEITEKYKITPEEAVKNFNTSKALSKELLQIYPSIVEELREARELLREPPVKEDKGIILP